MLGGGGGRSLVQRHEGLGGGMTGGTPRAVAEGGRADLGLGQLGRERGAVVRRRMCVEDLHVCDGADQIPCNTAACAREGGGGGGGGCEEGRGRGDREVMGR